MKGIIKLNVSKMSNLFKCKLKLKYWLLLHRRKPQRDTRANRTSSGKRQWKVRLLEAIKPRWRSVDVKIFEGIEIPSVVKKKVLRKLKQWISTDTLINKLEKWWDKMTRWLFRNYWMVCMVKLTEISWLPNVNICRAIVWYDSECIIIKLTSAH